MRAAHRLRIRTLPPGLGDAPPTERLRGFPPKDAASAPDRGGRLAATARSRRSHPAVELLASRKRWAQLRRSPARAASAWRAKPAPRSPCGPDDRLRLRDPPPGAMARIACSAASAPRGRWARLGARRTTVAAHGRHGIWRTARCAIAVPQDRERIPIIRERRAGRPVLLQASATPAPSGRRCCRPAAPPPRTAPAHPSAPARAVLSGMGGGARETCGHQ